MTLSRRQFTQASLSALSLAALGCNATASDTVPVIHKAIPASGERIPIVGLGTNRYGVDTSKAARAPLRAALQRFRYLGGTVIDTAPRYYTSETVLGDLMSELDIRDHLFVATKSDRSTATAVRRQLSDSATNLKTQTFDLMQVHNLSGWRTALPILREQKQEGRIRYIGITTSRESQYEDFEAVMRAEDLDFIQINYSLGQRGAASRILPLAQDQGVAVMINRAFGGGRIFGAVGDQPLPEWAKDFGASSWAQFLLKYAIGHPAATVCIPGMTKLRHVDDNFGAARGRLPDAAERKRQEQFFDGL